MSEGQPVPPLTGPGRLGIPISDDSSEDEQSQILALEEEKGIFHHEEVVVSPKDESDDDVPLQRFQLAHPPQPIRRDSDNDSNSDLSASHIDQENPPGLVAEMERRRSVRFSGPYDTEEDGQNPPFRSPSPESLRYIRALENPMAASGDLEDEFKDLIDEPLNPPPPGDPPAYTSADEGPRTAPPPPSSGGSSLGRPLSEIQLKFTDRRASRLEDDTSPSDDEEEEDDDYTEDEIAVLTYIDNYKPQEMDLQPELHPFTVEYMAAFGEVDTFIKVPRPDEIDDNVGLTAIDEPPCEQSDATIVDMQIRHATKDAAILDEAVPVKILEKADEKPDEILKWITDIKALHKNNAAPTVHKNHQQPDVETLMQEWHPTLDETTKTITLNIADLEVDLPTLVDIVTNIVDIPVGSSRIAALHAMFSLFNEFNNSQHFRNLAQNTKKRDDDEDDMNGGMDRLEL